MNRSNAIASIPDGYTLDYISGAPVKETAVEIVCQRVARALIHEYGFSPDDMERDFNMKSECG